MTKTSTASRARLNQPASVPKRTPVAANKRDPRGELERLTSLLQTLTENLPGGVLVEDDRVILHTNQQFCDLFGIPSPNLVLGTDCAAAARAASALFVDAAGFTRRIDEILAARAPVRAEVLALVDGRTFERDYVPVLFAGNVKGHLWQYRDISDRARAEAEHLRSLEQAHELERLRTLDRFKTDFIGMAAHDLGAPLRVVRYDLDVLQGRQPGTPEEREQSLASLERGIARIGQFVDDMLDAVRLQAAKLQIRAEAVDLASLVREATMSFQDAARQGQIKLEAKVPPRLMVHADPRRLRQVLDNLLTNALHFTRPKGRVTVTTTSSKGMGTVTVADTGMGIAADQMGRLFQPFSQVHNVRGAERTGSGLGLYICKGITELQGGRMWCESAGEGKGSAFHFTVPLAA